MVSSLRNHHYKKKITRCPIILKTKFGGNFVTLFFRQKCKNLKNEKHTILGNGEFYIVTNFQVYCAKTIKKRSMKVSVFDVTYVHRGRMS